MDIKEFNCEAVNISERELEIIKLIAEGYTNVEIAEKLFLSPHTVNTHRKNILQKLGINNTAAIVMYAVKTNLVSPNKFLFAPVG
jgi:DNA-binding CsgD family transcriptional regulator